MGDLPAGTVTFLFTDIEGSTRLVQRLGRQFKDLLEQHQAIIRKAVDDHGGVEVRSIGDGLFIAFAKASDGVAAAVEAQRALAAHPWPADAEIRVRMGLHTGEAISAAGDYVGVSVHEAARVSAAGHGGQILITEATRALAADDIPASTTLIDLGLHRLKDLIEPMRLYQVQHADLPSSFRPLKSLSVQPNNLPLHLTSFVGRDAEVSEIAKVIPTVRLLTLVGIGGAGKTRLSVEAAGDLLSNFGEGVWFVDLAPVVDPQAVPHAVLTAIGGREEPYRDLLDTAIEHIADGSMLLILDNCEHLVDACAFVADRLLRACGALRILATSREPLGVEGETIRRISPMAVPEARDDVEQILASDAVRLFLDRALASGPAFTLSPSNVRAVARICSRLDGIPLALELAAARARVISPEQIDARLEDVFTVLGKGSRTAPERQRTLRAAIEWSDDLLDKDERRLFYRLSVFAGRFSLEAAEGVCADDDVPVEQIVDLLTMLAQKSLITLSPESHETRYGMLMVVRRYAEERLEASGERARTRDRHLRWFADTTVRTSGARLEPLDRIEAEIDDIRAALSWGLDGGPLEDGTRLLAATGDFWMVRGHLREGHTWTTRYLARIEDPPAALLKDAGNLAQRLGAMDEGEGFLVRALEAARKSGDSLTETAALGSLGDAAHARGDYAAARARYEEALSIARATGGRVGVAALLGNLGHIAFGARDYGEAMKLYEESLMLSRSGTDERAVAEALQSYGRTLVAMTRYDAARAAYDEALSIARRLGDPQLAAVIISSRAILSLEQGAVEEAVAGHSEALAMRSDLGDVFGEAISRYHLAEALIESGDEGRARVLLEQSLETFREVGSSTADRGCADAPRADRVAIGSGGHTGLVRARGAGAVRAARRSARAVYVSGGAGRGAGRRRRGGAGDRGAGCGIARAARPRHPAEWVAGAPRRGNAEGGARVDRCRCVRGRLGEG